MIDSVKVYVTSDSQVPGMTLKEKLSSGADQL
jgi:hypothetical protein